MLAQGGLTTGMINLLMLSRVAYLSFPMRAVLLPASTTMALLRAVDLTTTLEDGLSAMWTVGSGADNQHQPTTGLFVGRDVARHRVAPPGRYAYTIHRLLLEVQSA
jgi:hypothetical protein